jgi:hypothetical protein
MYKRLSDDIMKLLNFELEHGNSVLDVGAGAGYNFVHLAFPFHTNDPGFADVLSQTIGPFEWGSPHYGEKYVGFRSTIFPYCHRARKTGH